MKIFLFVDNNPGTVGGTTFNSDKKHFRVLLCLKKYQMWFFDRKYKIIDFEKTLRFLRFLNKFTSHCVHLFEKCAPQSGITTSFKTLAILFKFLITRTWRHVPLDAYSFKNDFTYEFHGVNRILNVNSIGKTNPKTLIKGDSRVIKLGGVALRRLTVTEWITWSSRSLWPKYWAVLYDNNLSIISGD